MSSKYEEYHKYMIKADGQQQKRHVGGAQALMAALVDLIIICLVLLQLFHA